LDECDKLLNMGLIEDINTLTSWIQPERQVLLLSATYSDVIGEAARPWMTNAKPPIVLRVEGEAEGGTVQKAVTASPALPKKVLPNIPRSIAQRVEVLEDKDKAKSLRKFLNELYHEERRIGQRNLSQVILYIRKQNQA
jgi:superfamily II DNA/RNA helicase